MCKILSRKSDRFIIDYYYYLKSCLSTWTLQHYYRLLIYHMLLSSIQHFHQFARLYACEGLKNVVYFVNKYDRFCWRRGFQIQSSEQMSQGIYQHKFCRLKKESSFWAYIFLLHSISTVKWWGCWLKCHKDNGNLLD